LSIRCFSSFHRWRTFSHAAGPTRCSSRRRSKVSDAREGAERAVDEAALLVVPRRHDAGAGREFKMFRNRQVGGADREVALDLGRPTE
jgi:hypothetical protein